MQVSSFKINAIGCGDSFRNMQAFSFVFVVCLPQECFRTMNITCFLPDQTICKVQVTPSKIDAVPDSVMSPIDSQLFTEVSTTPQVKVTVHDMIAQCRAQDGCGYRASASSTPRITTVSESTNGAGYITFTIAGSGLLSDSTGTSADIKLVRVGAVECIATTWTVAAIVCTLAEKQLAGVSNVLVYVPGKARFPRYRHFFH